MSQHGYLEISDAKGAFRPKKVRILRAHLEEDAGKSMHDEVAGKADSRIDLNRTGTPLLEIVSQPDMRSPQEARAYSDRVETAADLPGRFRLQHAGGQPAGRREHQPAHRDAAGNASPRRSWKSRT
jgi:Asp-tRNA(Asn)/Glu-tRNA(Gln) amidotransferase B subunit